MNFKIIVVFIALAIISVSTAPADEPEATILKYIFKPNANNDGGYTLEYELSDGQSRNDLCIESFQEPTRDWVHSSSGGAWAVQCWKPAHGYICCKKKRGTSFSTR